jgi:hypothetical protein
LIFWVKIQNLFLLLGKFIAGDFIAIAGEMHRFPASNENTNMVVPFVA